MGPGLRRRHERRPASISGWALREQGFERVELRAATGNLASQRVAEKAGFVREGVARNAGHVHDGRVDLVVYSLTRADLGARGRGPVTGRAADRARISAR